MTYIIDLDVVTFCSIECRLQMSGELSVGWMVNGFVYAQRTDDIYRSKNMKFPTVTDVIELGKIIEPDENRAGFRKVNVQIGSDIIGWENIPSQMVNLCEAAPRLTPNEFFYEYERIHPFRDGNGRTGQILFNWLNGTLFRPVWANNFFNDPRRTIGYGS